MKDPHNRSVRKKIEEEVVLRNNEKYSAALVQSMCSFVKK